MRGSVTTSKADAFITDWIGCYSASEGMNSTQRQLAVEFIGDSYFVGYGNLLPEAALERDGLSPVWIDRFTDHHQGMAALCGRTLNQRYNAIWRVVARSGRGMVRNYPGIPDRSPLPAEYFHLVKQLQGRRERCITDVVPGVIVINLGTNDFSTPLDVLEPFSGSGGLEQSFTAAYHQFLDALASHYRGAAFLLVGVPYPASMRQPELLAHICEARQTKGEPAYFCRLPEVPLTGCDGHPGLKGHQRCAEVLTQAIGQILTTHMNHCALEGDHG